MRLEEIARMYGMNDYYDMHTGRVYHLSEATDNGNGTQSVPVTQSGDLIGYATMEKAEV